MSDQYAHVRGLPLLGVLAALGFTEWKSRKNGAEHFGRCPVHDPKKNNSSFSFDATGRFQCFSCHAKGKGAIDLLMAIERISFRQAVERLEGLNVPAVAAAPVEQVDDVVENPPFKGSYEKFKVESAWLKERGLTTQTLERYEVFQYDNPKRRSAYSGSVMLKIRRWQDGECVGYLSRNTGAISPEKPKYRFPEGFQKRLELFGAYQLKEKAPIRVLYVLESPLAVMAFHQHGLAAVSPFGFSVSAEQVRTIAQLTRGVIYLPDRNKRDQISGCIESLSRFVWVKAPELPDGIEDPESLSRSQIVALTSR